jgi:hypothetical protein
MKLNVIFLVDKVLYLLFLPGLARTKEFKEFFLFFFAELRGPSAPEVRR